MNTLPWKIALFHAPLSGRLSLLLAFCLAVSLFTAHEAIADDDDNRGQGSWNQQRGWQGGEGWRNNYDGRRDDDGWRRDYDERRWYEQGRQGNYGYQNAPPAYQPPVMYAPQPMYRPPMQYYPQSAYPPPVNYYYPQ